MNYYEEQLKRISLFLDELKKQNKSLKDVDDEFLSQYLNNSDIIVFTTLLNKFYFNRGINKKYKLVSTTPGKLMLIKEEKQDFKLSYTTPYTVLGIEEKEYSKEELLDIISSRIEDIKNTEKDVETMQKKVDSILDAYNEIIKDSKGQK